MYYSSVQCELKLRQENHNRSSAVEEKKKEQSTVKNYVVRSKITVNKNEHALQIAGNTLK